MATEPVQEVVAIPLPRHLMLATSQLEIAVSILVGQFQIDDRLRLLGADSQLPLDHRARHAAEVERGLERRRQN